MRKVVVDASIVAKWFVPEVHSEPAARVLTSDLALYAPDLLVAEFGNLLWKKVRREEIERDEAEDILNVFDRLPIELRPSSALLSAAFTLALELDRTVYDCLYLSLAVVEDCSLVTADAKFHAAVASTALASHVHWIETPI